MDLVVFDLDGTLIDSQRDIAAATNDLLTELGAPPLAQDSISAMVGEGARVLVGRVLRAAGIRLDARAALERYMELYDRRLLETTVPYPGIPEALETLSKRGPLAVLTNKPSRPTERVLEGVGLRSYFTEVIGGDTPLGRKPDPAGLLELVSRAGATAGATVLVGDSPVDLQTARNAGARICLARYGFGFRFQPGDLGTETVVDRASELVAAIAALSAHENGGSSTKE